MFSRSIGRESGKTTTTAFVTTAKAVVEMDNEIRSILADDDVLRNRNAPMLKSY